MKQSSGFTMPELLMVIILLGLLIAIAIPAYVNQQQKIRATQALIQMKALAIVIQEEAVKDGRYPPDVNRNTPPEGLRQEWNITVNALPSNARRLDYESWNDGCIVQLTWFGEDNIRQSPQNSLEVRGDDRAIQAYVCEETRR